MIYPFFNRLLIGIVCLSFTFPSYSQTSVESTIQQHIDKAWELTLSGNDSASFYAQNALTESLQYNYHYGEVMALEALGLYHEIITGNIDSASNEYFKAIALCEKYNLDYIASIYHTLGVMFHTTDNFENAKRYYNFSLEKARLKDDSILIKKCLTNLGSVYSSLDDYPKAEQCMLESLDFPIEKGMDYTTYANLGYLYVKQEKFDQAIPILLKATEVNIYNPDPELNLYFLLHAKTMARDSSNMKGIVARAIVAADSDKYGLRDQSLLYRNIADYLAFSGNYKKALEFRDKYIEVFEKIKENQRDQIVLDMEAKYASEKKDAQLKVLQLESEKKDQQKRLYLLLTLTTIIIAGLTGFFLIKNRSKNKILFTQNLKLEENVEAINLLLREVHHRVKNNLQVITSLLNIQQRSITDKKALQAIEESKNRIESMGLIHRSLYQNKNLGEINTREYISNLIHQLYASYSTDQNRIKLELNVEDVYLDMDTLVPLGLIINELVSNSIKYAFKEGENGKLSILLQKYKEEYKLEVSDSGTGIYNIHKLENSEAFGFKMIKAFVKKLNGNLSMSNTKGTRVEISFAAIN